MAKILLIIYDNGSRIPTFPQGLGYIGAQCAKDGHDVDFFLQDIFRTPDEHVTQILDKGNYDVVGLGFCAGYYQFSKCFSISQAVNKSKNRKNFEFVLGGHGPAGSPEYFLGKFDADMVVHGEGELFLRDMERYGRYYQVLNTTANIKEINIDDYPWPSYDLPVDIYKRISFPTSKPTDFCMSILSGRGCPYKCTFCFRMDESFRPRDPKAVIEEMEYLWVRHRVNHFQFSDELLMSSTKRTVDFCEEIIRSKLFKDCKRLKWDCNGRLNFAIPEVLHIMKKAKCEYINYGIESLNDMALVAMNKKLTVETITKGVKATLKADITPGLNILWGNVGDSFGTLNSAITFLKKFDACKELRTIRPVTPYPGTVLFKAAIECGFIKDAQDFYENKHKNSDLFTCNFMGLSNNMANQAICDANLALYLNYQDKKLQETRAQLQEFYTNGGSFRGFREV